MYKGLWTVARVCLVQIFEDRDGQWRFGSRLHSLVEQSVAEENFEDASKFWATLESLLKTNSVGQIWEVGHKLVSKYEAV